MAAKVGTDGARQHTATGGAGRTAPGSGRLGKAGLLEKFHHAVRRPDLSGGVSVLPLLLDLIAEADPPAAGTVWIPDTIERFGTTTALRNLFPDPDVQVAASQYGEDAYRRGWLRLDRTLGADEHSSLVQRSAAWAVDTDRTVHDVLDEFGPPSITHGDPDPCRPKSLAYACGDRNAPVVAFHFAPERTAHAGAALLAVHGVEGGYFGLQLTPYGMAALSQANQAP